MKTSVIGFPRVGKLRELKFVTEKFFRGEADAAELEKTGKEIRLEQWKWQKDSRIDFIPSGDFSFYDTTLDAAVLFNIIPKRYKTLGLSEQDTYFAMARGYQGAQGDVKALAHALSLTSPHPAKEPFWHFVWRDPEDVLSTPVSDDGKRLYARAFSTAIPKLPRRLPAVLPSTVPAVCTAFRHTSV